MNQYIQDIACGSVSARNIADWAISHGINSLSTEEIAHLIGVPSNQVSQRLHPFCKRNQLFSPARGLWIPVRAEYRTWQAPDPITYIDEMMNYLEVDYCIGWLTSAAFHGASHHASQVFQVATNRTIRNKKFGRSRLEFFQRQYVDTITTTCQNNFKSRAKIASAGTTMLMVMDDIDICGGCDIAANIVIELAEENPNYCASIINDAQYFSDASIRRIGWLLDNYYEGAPEGIKKYCDSAKSSISFLSPSDSRTGSLDSRWKIIINRKVEPDV